MPSPSRLDTTSILPAGRRPRASWAASVAAVLLLAGCGSGGPEEPATNPACTPAPTPAPTVSGPLAAFDLDGLVQVTRVYEADGFFVIDGLSTGAIPDLATTFFGIVEEAGYSVAGSDDEGFEAEVFFAAGQIAAGQVILTESDCPGAVDVKITLLDDLSVSSRDETSTTPTATTS